jgi:WD40 repeat protein
MDLRVACPSCGQSYGFKETHVGRTARCSKCKTAFEVTTIAPSAGSTIQTPRQPQAERSVVSASASVAAPVPVPATASVSGTTSVPGQNRRLGRFLIQAELGSGSFGAVYRAFDDVLKRDVALKLPHAAALSISGVGERFLREAEAAAQLHHPHIVPIYDAGAEGNQLYIASAFIDGKTMQDSAAERRPNAAEAARLVMKLALALDYAHGKNVVHRDVKPANVMLDKDGEPHLMDFGLARWEQADQQLTQEGSLLGTPAYMSPEQAGAPVGPVGPASDQYALGVMLYELLCGQVPFRHPLMPMLLGMIRDQQPQSPRAVKPSIPSDLETICLKAMAKRPADRYARASALAEDLRRYLDGEPILARRLGPLERLTRWAARNKTVAGLTAGVAVLLVVVAGVSLFSAARMAVLRDREADATQTALAQARRAEEQQKLAEASAQTAAAERIKADAERVKAQTEATRAQEEKQKADQSAAVAQQERQKATTAADEAEKRRIEAVQSADKLRRQLYATDMYLLQAQKQAWRLTRHVPKPNETDLRGFEWYYLNRQFNKSPVRRLDGDDQAHFTAVAYSPDGKFLAAADGRHSEIIVWNTADWTVRHRFRPRGRDTLEQYRRLSFSADSSRLVGSLDPSHTQAAGRIWDLATGNELDADVGPAVSMSRDGKRFATARLPRDSENPKFAPHIAFFDAAEIEGRTLLTPPIGVKPRYPKRAPPAQHSIPVQSETVDLLMSPDGKKLVYAGKTEGVRLYDVLKKKEVRILDNDCDNRCFAFSNDGIWLALGSPTGTQVFDTRSDSFGKKVGFAATGVAFSPDAMRLVGSNEYGSEIYEISTGNTLQKMSKATGFAAYSPDAAFVATGGGGIEIWGTSGDLRTVPLDAENVMSLLSSPDGKLLAVCKFDQSVDVYAFDSGQKKYVLPGRPIRLKSLEWQGSTVPEHRLPDAGVFSPDGKRIALIAQDGRLKVWNSDDGSELISLEGVQQDVVRIAFGPDGKTVAVAGDNPLLKVWNVETGAVVRSIDTASSQKFARIFFSPGGRKLVQAVSHITNQGFRTAGGGVSVRTTTGSELAVWDVATGNKHVLFDGKPGYLGGVSFTADESKLLVQYTGTNGKDLGEMFDIDQGRSLGYRAFGQCTSDGKRIVRSEFSTDNQIYLVSIVDFATGNVVCNLEDTGLPAGSPLEVSPDSRRLFCGSRMWDVETGMAVFDPEYEITKRLVTFSGDGKYLALCGPKGLAILDGSPDR